MCGCENCDIDQKDEEMFRENQAGDNEEFCEFVKKICDTAY